MERYKFVVLSNPVAGREEEYNRWYDEVHLADVLRVPGFVAAQRLEAVEPGAEHHYLAIYDIETDDVAATFEALTAGARDGSVPVSDAMDRAGVRPMMFRERGPKRTG